MKANTLKLSAAIALALSAATGNTACPTWPTAGRFTINDAEVTDKRTGLTWKRCAEGQAWSGTACTGTVSTFAHQAALIYTKAQTGWRLPNAKELASLVDRGCIKPAIDSAAFPNTPADWFWSSSPDVGYSNFAWNVYFYNGYVGSNDRDNSRHVRLVRASQ
jgi:hypothetical protein